MAVNYRVTAQANKMVEAYRTPEYEAEKEKYWQILEEEYLKEPRNGWIGLEDPEDSLNESIGNDDAKWTEETLEFYLRFYKITGWKMNEELVHAAKVYIETGEDIYHDFDE